MNEHRISILRGGRSNRSEANMNCPTKFSYFARYRLLFFCGFTCCISYLLNPSISGLSLFSHDECTQHGIRESLYAR